MQQIFELGLFFSLMTLGKKIFFWKYSALKGNTLRAPVCLWEFHMCESVLSVCDTFWLNGLCRAITSSLLISFGGYTQAPILDTFYCKGSL